MDNSTILNRIFTQNTFKEILNDDAISETYLNVIKRYTIDDAHKKNLELISEIYEYMDKNYRNEYFYKNTMLNKLLLGVHKPNTTTGALLLQADFSERRTTFHRPVYPYG